MTLVRVPTITKSCCPKRRYIGVPVRMITKFFTECKHESKMWD